MSAIDDLFSKLRSEGRKAFMPFITAGDPDLEMTQSLLVALDEIGCHMCEVGIPYSDPIADGPVIQASYTRALESGIKLSQIFEAAKGVAKKISMPTVTMVSYAIIYRQGVDAYLKRAIDAGFSGAIVPDLPAEEARSLLDPFQQHDFSLIPLITPTTPRPRAAEIASQASGFIYYVSVTGITGERQSVHDDVIENVTWLKSQTDLPVCIGFGISQPEHVAQLAPVADGLIVGSAIVRRIAKAQPGEQRRVLADIQEYVASLLAAL